MHLCPFRVLVALSEEAASSSRNRMKEALMNVFRSALAALPLSAALTLAFPAGEVRAQTTGRCADQQTTGTTQTTTTSDGSTTTTQATTTTGQTTQGSTVTGQTTAQQRLNALRRAARSQQTGQLTASQIALIQQQQNALLAAQLQLAQQRSAAATQLRLLQLRRR
jgi:hypothetical protein